MSDEVEVLAGARRGHMIAPAGHGKTHLIARAVAERGRGNELVLTHTHAGVNALRESLRRLGASQGSYRVETIAGFALRYAAALPEQSGLSTLRPRENSEWQNTYESAARALGHRHLSGVVCASYTGAYVDEYQDCTLAQHGLVLAIAELLPCRVLGDPLQGIFGFGQNIPVEWGRDVEPHFPALTGLNTPWRWRLANRELGSWLKGVREALQAGKDIGLRGAPVRWKKLSSNPIRDQVAACMDVADRCDGDGTIVAIHRWPRECHAVAKRLRGRFDCMEPIDSADLLTAATAIQVAQGVERVSQVAAFASQCLTKVEAELKTVLKVVETGRRRRGHTYKRQAQLDALLAVAEDESLGPVLPALDSIRAVSGTILYRRELFYEMRRALQSYAAGGYDTLSEAVWHARNRTRRHGRFTQRCVVGRTLLAKGLEFDHAVVLDAGKLDTKNLYVAMTRGTRSLTILSKAPVLRPNRRE